MSSIPSYQKAIVTNGPKEAALVTDRAIPALRDDYLLVRVESVALNPTDWKHIDFLSPPSLLVGCDYAGTVIEIGKDVKKPWKKGDRIAGVAHGCNAGQPEDGTFAEYIVVKGDVQFHIPDHLSFQEACTLGVAVGTSLLALYQGLHMARPATPISHLEPVLIYGGSTASGTIAIQFAKLSGYQVITTCSPRNFHLVRDRGADAVFDYNDPAAAAQIRTFTNNSLKLVLDTISVEATAQFCSEALSTEGGSYVSLRPAKVPREDVRSSGILTYTVIGEPFSFGPKRIPANPQSRAIMEEHTTFVEDLLDQKKLKPHPLLVGANGLAGVCEGLDRMRQDAVSGQKLVYNVSETPCVIGTSIA